MRTNKENSKYFEIGREIGYNLAEKKEDLTKKFKEIEKSNKRAVNIGKLGLIGLTIGAMTFLGKPKEERISKDETPQKGDYVENTIQGVEYTNNQADKNHYRLEGQVLFKSLTKGKENAYFLEKNQDIDEGELDFTMTPQDEALVWAPIEPSSEKPVLEGTEYVPKQITKNGKVVNAIEIKDKRLAAKFKNELKKRTREKSESDFGYSFDINDQDIEKNFPQKTIGDKDYLYVDASRGKVKYLIKDGESLEKKVISFPETTLPEMFIPLSGETKYSINSKGNPIIYNPQGFFRPVKESQESQNPQDTINTQDTINPQDNINHGNTRLEQSQTEVYHIAKEGDTFWRLGIIHFGSGEEADKIQKLNPDIHPDSIKVDQKIRIK